MAKKRVISKKKVTEIPMEDEKASKKGKKKEQKIPEEDVGAFDLDEVPESAEEELSDIEEEIMGEESDFEEEIEEERYYTIPLAKEYQKSPTWKRSKKAVKAVREFLEQHMKPIGPVYISQDVNERIWEKGIKNPPRKIRVRVTRSIDGIVRAYVA